MDHSPLSRLICALERGTKLHICVAFMKQCGNQKTICPHSQATHNQPVCMAVKQSPQGLASCSRCRRIVQKAMIRRQKSLSGYCANGVYEYCRPVIYDGEVVCVIFVGNILTDDPAQRRRLEARVDSELLDTMEHSVSPEECSEIADILESYIVFLLDHYGVKDKTLNSLAENIKAYIRENLPYELSMAELAAVFNYTEKYLGRVFRLRTGQTVKEYCNGLRINRAKELLADVELSIAAVALQTGFNSTTYFDRVFRKAVGLSPQAYRNSKRNL